jgi:hypothetical protein
MSADSTSPGDKWTRLPVQVTLLGGRRSESIARGKRGSYCVSAKRAGRKRPEHKSDKGPSQRKRPTTAADAARSDHTSSGPKSDSVRARKRADDEAWELVHPRCARERADDLAEVRTMLEQGEWDIARDECRWLLVGCRDCLEAHRLLGEIALLEDDLPLARGHFGYAYRLGTGALAQAGVTGPLPYRLPANQGFFESAKGLAVCLARLGKREMAEEVVTRVLACDPSDPLHIRDVLSAPPAQPPG